MIVRGLRLRAFTSAGEAGVTMRFDEGLVLVRADGGKGKSNAMLGIIYALGLEDMLGPGRSSPLKHAMNDMVEIDGVDEPVLASDVILEVSNREGRTVTILRTVKGERRPELVTVIQGPALGGDLTGLQGTDYYVRLPGGATNEQGFHRFLAMFLGWDLPKVMTYTGDAVPLYVQTIFPLVFVEQMRGWSAIEGVYPTHFRVREPAVRAAEFLLKLDVYDVELKRSQIEREIEQLRNQWTVAVRSLDAIAKQLGAMHVGVPSHPVAKWPPEERVGLIISANDEWIPVEEFIGRLQATLRDLPKVGDELVEDAAPRVQEELTIAETRVRAVESWLSDVLREVDALQADLDRTTLRILAIDEDLVRNKDAVRLRRLGSTQKLSIASDECPTCHQSVELALLPEVRAEQASPMSLEDNVKYLADQREMFVLIAAQTEESIKASMRRVTAGQAELNAARAAIREMKAALVSHPKARSETTIAERVRLETRIEGLGRGSRHAQELIMQFSDLSERWRAAQERVRTLPETRLSVTDRRKVEELQKSFRAQIVDYGLASLRDPREINIDEDALRPEYKGYNLQYDLAGSDVTRATWAYRASFLEVARAFETNHPGILIFDEPLQQSPSDQSYGAFLRRMSEARVYGQQVLIATNEKPSKLLELLEGRPVQMLDYGEDRIMRLV